MLRRTALALGFLGLGSLVARDARAGGFFLPDNGVQGLSRGGAFTAKADDATAVLYNVAGLARQRGTRLEFSGNLQFHEFGFTRAGNYPDATTAETPWGPAPYFTVKNENHAYLLPFLGITTDFGVFDRFTAGFSIYGPPAVGNRTFPLGVAGYPAPGRYDYSQSKTSLLYPTVSGAFRITPWLDAGVSAQLVMLDLNQTTVSFVDASAGACGYAEHYICDNRTVIDASGKTVTGNFGLMARPVPSFAAGLSVQGPAKINASGTATATPPVLTSTLKFDPGTAEITVKLPWTVRLGARYIGMQGKFEQWDAEINATYETWGSAQSDGPRVQIPKLGPYSNIDTIVVHNYNDTVSVRVGGAYNINTGSGLVTLRAGGFFDSSATDTSATRIDYDTLTKVAGTLGAAYKYSFATLSVGYAAIRSVPRDVTDGIVRPINGARQGQAIDATGAPLPVVNNGHYFGFTHVLTFGIAVAFDTLFGNTRKSAYGDDRYEDLAVADAPAAPSAPGVAAAPSP